MGRRGSHLLQSPQVWQGAAGMGEGSALLCAMLQPFSFPIRCQMDIPMCQRNPRAPSHPTHIPPTSKQFAQERKQQ